MAEDKPNVPRWRGQAQSAEPYRAPAPSASRQKKAFGLIAVMLAISGATLAWLLYVRPMTAPYFLSLPLREYAHPDFPVSALAVQDSDLLAQHFPEEQRKKAYESQTRERLRLELQNLRTRSDDAIVVHLCGLARGPALTAGEGAKEDDVFILPADADPGEPRTWLSLREVLESLRQCPASHKLLLLDVMRPVADPRLGVPADDIGTRVQELLEKEPLSNLLVLCACGKGELSLVSENLKQSVFAYYLDQGLRGPADGLGGGREDRRITAKELAAYVQPRVDRWARQHRGVSQKPVLLGQGDDFALAHLNQSTSAAAPAWQDLATLPSWLRAGWEMRDAWADEGGYRTAPRLVRELENVLLRSEQRWLGGIEEDRLKNELKSDLDVLEAQRKKVRELPRCEPMSLALARNFTPKLKEVDPALEDALAELLRRAGELTAKPGDLDKGLAPFKEKFKAAAVVPVAWTAVELTRKLAQPMPAQVLVMREAIRALHPDAPYAEVVFLQRLLELRQRVEENEWTWPAPAVKQSLGTLQQSEAALAALAAEPGFQPWLAEFFDQADKLRRSAEKALFTRPPSGWVQATQESRQAELIYTETLVRLENLRRARFDFDEATVLLPGFMLVLVNLPQPETNEDWKSAIQAGRKLGDLLQSIDTKAGGVELENHAELRQYILGLRGFVQARSQRFLSRAGQGSARDMQDFLALRSSPRFTAKERDALWKAGQGLARRLQKEMDETANEPPVLFAAAEAERKIRRRDLSIDLLRLAGYPGADALPPLDKSATPRAWADASAALREVWIKKLPEKMREGEKDLPRANRLSRIVPLGQTKGVDPNHWSFSPATTLARDQAQAMLRWQGERYRAEAQQLPAGSAAATFYGQAADKCLR